MADFENLTKNFKRLIENNKLSHAYLFSGDSLEKFAFAQSLANFLENGVFEVPTKLLKETFFVVPDEKGVIGIDSIRTLKHFLWQKPLVAQKRTVIIVKAENLTPEAQNSALKIIEEPPESALIIFIANNEDNILPVLSSRLQKIYFPKAEADNLPAYEYVGDQNIDQITENIDQFFESLINKLKKEPIKNSKKLKAALHRLALIKQFNTNKRLQLKALLLWEKDWIL